MFVFAQIQIDARTEFSPEDVIHELKSESIRIVLRRRQLRAEDYALS